MEILLQFTREDIKRAVITPLGNHRLIGPIREVPKSWLKVTTVTSPTLCSDYQSGLVTIYKANDGGLRATFYLDGCFNHYAAKLKILKEDAE